MARMNLRPIYDADETSGGSRIATALQGALGAYAQHQEVGQQEEARRRAAGQVMTTRGEGGVDRLRDLGRRLLRRPDPADGPVNVAATSAPPPGWTPPAPTSRIIPPRVAVDATTPPDRPVFATSTAPSATPVPPIQVTPDRGVATSAAPALNGATPTPPRPHTIGSALDAYTENDNFGNQWTVDPNREANRQLAAHNAMADSDEERKEALTDRQDNEKIEALVAAGMPRAEAAARVKNNVVKYDTEFGQQFRPGAGGVSQKDWVARENLRQQHRLDMERAHATGRISSQQLAQERLALQKEEMEDRRAQAEERARGADVTRATTIGNAINSTLTKDPIAQSTMTPEQKAAEAKRAKERDANIATATSGAVKLRNSHATAEEARARAQALKTAGRTPEQIRTTMQAEGYRIH